MHNDVLDTERKPITLGQKVRVFFKSGATMLATVIHLDSTYQTVSLQFGVEAKYCQRTDHTGQLAEAHDADTDKAESMVQAMYNARTLADHYEEEALDCGPDSPQGSIFQEVAEEFKTIMNLLGDPKTLPAV